MQRLEVSGVVRPLYGSLGVKGLRTILILSFILTPKPSKLALPFRSVKMGIIETYGSGGGGVHLMRSVVIEMTVVHM